MSDTGRGRVAGKVAVVTGGAGGIGSATAHALAREGAGVAVLDIDGAGAERVAAEIVAAGGVALAVGVDLSEEEGVVLAIRRVVDRFGRLDVLHNNAALTDSGFLDRDTPVTDLDLEVWERTLAVNLTSQMLTCKHAVPEMVRGGGGSIVNMSSGASLKGDRTRTAYGVSKAGVNALTMYVATSHGKQNIRVNAIVPGSDHHRCRPGPPHRGDPERTRPCHPHHPSGGARRHRQHGGVPGLGRVPVHHRTVAVGRRRHVRPCGERRPRRVSRRRVGQAEPRMYSPVSGWWVHPPAACVPPSTWRVWPVT